MLTDIDLNKYTKAKYGNAAQATISGSHLYDWYASINGVSVGSLDMNEAVQQQYNVNYKAVYTGVHAYNWKACNLSAEKYKFTPVLLVSNNKMHDIQGVALAVVRLKRVVEFARSWIFERVGKTFEYTDVLCLHSFVNSEYWIELSERARLFASTQPERYHYFDQVNHDISENFPMLNSLKYIAAVYIGNETKYTEGMANSNNISALSPDIAALDFDVADLSTLARVQLSGSTHEILHNIGLPHHESGHSIMNRAQVPYARLEDDEIAQVLKSDYIR